MHIKCHLVERPRLMCFLKSVQLKIGEAHAEQICMQALASMSVHHLQSLFLSRHLSTMSLHVA